MKCDGWSATIPRMVTHHSKDGHPPSKIYQKEEYYRLEIFFILICILFKMCYVHLVLEEFYHSTTELVPKEIALIINRELPQYYIHSWQLDYMTKIKYLQLF